MAIDWFLLVRTTIESTMLAWGFSKLLERKYPLIFIQLIFTIVFCLSNLIGNIVSTRIIQVPYIAKIQLAILGMILIVNSVLCCKVEQAKKKGIDFHIDLHIRNTVPYETLDLSSLFSNLIDNAIENSSKSMGKKYIYLTDYEAGNLYTVKIINSKNEERIQTKGGKLLTSKEDADKHGYGTQIIQKIAEKYNGEVQFLDEGE